LDQEGWTVEHALDRNRRQPGNPSEDRPEPSSRVRIGRATHGNVNATLTFVIKQLHGEGHVIGRPRLTVTDAQWPAPVRVLPVDVQQILSVSPEQRTDDQRAALAAFSRKDGIKRELAILPRPSLVYAAASEFEPDGGLKPAPAPRPVHMLQRGDIKHPIEAAPARRCPAFQTWPRALK
jgi:hypothetical protein